MFKVFVTAYSLLISSVLLAQNRSDSNSLSRDTLSQNLRSVTVYAYNSNTEPVNVPAAVAVLNAAQLTAYDVVSLGQSFNTIPGVKFDERSPGSYRLSIRGNLLRSAFGVRNVKIYLDDLPFTDASGNTYLNALAPVLLQSAEIVKGPAGSLYGAGTGGAVFLKPGGDQSSRFQLQVTGGNLGAFSSSLGFKSRNHFAQVSHSQSDGYRDQSSMRRENIFYQFQQQQNRHKLKANVLFSNLSYETPGGLTLPEMLRNPQQARPRAGVNPGAAEQDAAIDLNIFYVNISNELRLRDNLLLNAGIYFSADGQVNPAIRNYEQKHEAGGGGRFSLRWSTDRIKLIAGTEFQTTHTNTATYGNRRGRRDTLQFHDLIDVKQVNVFAQGSIDLPLKTVLTAGVSYNDFSYRFQRLGSGNRESGNFSPQVIPRVTLLKKIKDIASVYLSYSKGYSPPTIDEIHASDGVFNTALSAENAENYEGGAKASLFQSRLNFSFAYYILHLRNTIVSRRDASGADFYVNAGSTDQRGAELTIDYATVSKPANFFNRFSSFISFGSTRAFFKNYRQGLTDLSGNRLTGTPLHTFSGGAGLLMKHGLYLNSSFTYTDRIPLNDANAFFEDPRLIFFGRAGRKSSTGLVRDIYFAAQRATENLFSAGNDINAAGNRFYNPSAPYVYYAGVTLAF